MELSSSATASLRAAISVIVPADEWPGAVELGVETYIVRQVTRTDDHLGEDLQVGLDCLAAEADARYGLLPGKLEQGRMERLLKTLEMGVTCTSWSLDARGFVQSLVRLTMEGYYGDPGNGGNIGKQSWQMIGFTDGPVG